MECIVGGFFAAVIIFGYVLLAIRPDLADDDDML